MAGSDGTGNTTNNTAHRTVNDGTGNAALNWVCRGFGALSAAELYQIIALRQEVFVVEQACVFRDLDGLDLDQGSLHLCAWRGGTLCAYLRALPPGLAYAESSLGRIVVSAQARGTNLGRELVRRGIALNREHWPGQGIRIGAQARLERFYREFGFLPTGDSYMEDGILHIKMLLAAG